MTPDIAAEPARTIQTKTLWRNPDFLKVRVGETVSLLGPHVMSLGLPVTAVLVFDATPADLGTDPAGTSTESTIAKPSAEE